MDLKIIDEPADSLVATLPSPGHAASYPALRHRHRIPPGPLQAMEAIWNSGHFPGRAIRVHRLRHVFVAEEGLVFNADGHLYRSSRTQHADAEVQHGFQALQHAASTGEIEVSTGSMVLAKKRGATNYGHWLIEMLPRAFLAARERSLGPGLGYLVPLATGQMAETIQRSCALAGLDPARTFPLGSKPVFVEELLLFAELTSHGNFLSPRVLDCTDHIAGRLPPDPPAPVYVTRRTGGVRCFDNELELTALLRDRGFRILDPALLRFDEQVQAFRAATAVVGVMGAGLTNIVFAPPGVPVVSLAPAAMPDTFFWMLANIRRQPYHEIRCEQRGPSRGAAAWDTDLHLSAAELATILDEAGVPRASALRSPTRAGAIPAIPTLPVATGHAPVRSAPPLVAAPPRILALSIVKNEQDIIEPFVRHTIGLVDAMVVVDDASADATRDILLRLAREFPTLVVTEDRRDSGRLAARMTRLLQGAQAAFLADYAIPLEAHEFLRLDPSGDVARMLWPIPPGGFGLIPVQTFVLAPDQDEARDPPRDLRWRRATEPPDDARPILRLAGQGVPDLAIHHLPPGVRSASGAILPPPVMLAGLHIQSFPLRSRSQIIGKTVTTWTDLLSRDPNPREPAALHWRAMFERVTASPALDPPALRELSRACGLPPGSAAAPIVPGSPPDDYARAHSTGMAPEPVTLVGRAWAASCLPQTRLLSLPRPDLRDLPPVPGVEPLLSAAWRWDNLRVDVAPWRFLADKHHPDSVLEIGTGTGANLAALKRLGIADVFGVDGLPPQAVALEPWEYMACDLAAPLDLRRRFWAVLCLDFAQALPGAVARAHLLDTLTRHADQMIVFAGAGRPVAHWLECFAARGWRPDLEETLNLRSLSHVAPARRDLLVLRPGADSDHATAERRLVDIAARPLQPRERQPAGIRQAALDA